MKRGASVKSIEMWKEEHRNILDVMEALHDHEHVVDANAEAEKGEYGVHRGVPIIWLLAPSGALIAIPTY